MFESVISICLEYCIIILILIYWNHCLDLSIDMLFGGYSVVNSCDKVNLYYSLSSSLSLLLVEVWLSLVPSERHTWLSSLLSPAHCTVPALNELCNAEFRRDNLFVSSPGLLPRSSLLPTTRCYLNAETGIVAVIRYGLVSLMAFCLLKPYFKGHYAVRLCNYNTFALRIQIS